MDEKSLFRKLCIWITKCKCYTKTSVTEGSHVDMRKQVFGLKPKLFSVYFRVLRRYSLFCDSWYNFLTSSLDTSPIPSVSHIVYNHLFLYIYYYYYKVV